MCQMRIATFSSITIILVNIRPAAGSRPPAEKRGFGAQIPRGLKTDWELKSYHYV